MKPAPLTQARPLSAREAEAVFLGVLDEHETALRGASPLLAPTAPTSPVVWQGLLSLNDDTFIDEAFHTLLGRPPDPDGRRYYMNALAAGHSRVLVLGGLRYGSEGRALARHTPGLRSRYVLHRLYRLGVAGRALRTLTAIAALPGLIADVERLWREAAMLGSEMRRSADALSALRARIDGLSADLRRDAQVFDHRHRLAVDQLGARVGEQLDRMSGRLDAEPWADPIVLLADREDALAVRLEAIGQVAERAAALARTAAASPDPDTARATRLELDKLYVAFEDRFRGSRATIKQRQSIYLDVLRWAGAGTPERPIVDVGSGRGELLELLGEAGLTARGVDLNKAMVTKCRALGLECTQADAVAYLERLEPGSLGAVTGFHVIEHLPFPIMVALFDASLRALAPGGLVIFETPNPANVTVASRWFYLDPTHRNPLPAEMVSMIAAARGFSDVEIRELHPMQARFAAQDEGLGAQLDGLFHGPQDYALIARRDA